MHTIENADEANTIPSAFETTSLQRLQGAVFASRVIYVPFCIA
jgi:hypothetical protein